jgi:hypothetical protein
LDELPWSGNVSYELIRLGKLESARLTVLGKNNDRGIRLVSKKSVDALLTELAAEQSKDPTETTRLRIFADVGAGKKTKKREEALT